MNDGKAPKTGVLIANLGTPSGTGYRAMRRYLAEFLWDRRVIEPPPARWLWWLILNGIILVKRPFSSGAAYRKIWNEALDESPLLTITRDQRDALQSALSAEFGTNIETGFCMRYGEPSTGEVLHRMIHNGCTRFLFLPLYPQYAAATTATACDALLRELMKLRDQPTMRIVPPYYAEPRYIAALAGSVASALASSDGVDAVLASYHGLPERYVSAGDPYRRHCEATSALLSRALDQIPEMADIPLVTAFQSRFGKEPWLQPYTVDAVAELARSGKRRIAVLAPGFAADCVETLEEINEEIRDAFQAAGGRDFIYIPCLNASEAHIDALCHIIRRELFGWLPAQASSAT